MLKNSQKGVSIYLTVMIMALILSVALGMGAILVGQIKMVRNMGYSVVSFYAADTGIERAMYAIRKESSPYVPGSSSQLCGAGNYFGNTCQLDNGAIYSIEDNSAPNCGGSGIDVCISSKGKNQKTNRAIEISW